jgi:hypothetical protein
MRDRLFFSLAAFLMLSLLGLAVWPGIGRLPTGAVAGDGFNYERVEIEGAYLNKVIAGGDAITRLVRDGADIRLYIEARAGALADAPELGPHFRLAADLEKQFAGRRLRVTVRLRPADQRGAEQVQINYSAGRAGESGWQVFDLRPDFSDVSFEYDVPPVVGEQGVDYLAIRPFVPDKTRAVVVEQIIFERIGGH